MSIEDESGFEDEEVSIEVDGNNPYIIEIGPGKSDFKGFLGFHNREKLGDKLENYKTVDVDDKFEEGTGLLGYSGSDTDKNKVDLIFINNVFGEPWSNIAEKANGILRNHKVIETSERVDKEAERKFKESYLAKVYNLLGWKRDPKMISKSTSVGDQKKLAEFIEPLTMGLYEKLKPGGVIIITEAYSPSAANYIRYFDFKSIGIDSLNIDSNIYKHPEIRKFYDKDEEKFDSQILDLILDFLNTQSQELLKMTFDRFLDGVFRKPRPSSDTYDEPRNPFLLVLYKPLGKKDD